MRRDAEVGQHTGRLPRRPADRVEDVVAWLLTAASLFVVIAAVVVGVSVYAQQSDTAGMAVGHAVLLEDAEAGGPADPGPTLPVPVTATWTTPDGGQRTGVILVKPATAAGTQVDVWIDADGTATAASLGHGYAVLAGIATGLVVVLFGGALIGLAWRGVHRATGASNARRWEREWERVGPDWTGRPL